MRRGMAVAALAALMGLAGGTGETAAQSARPRAGRPSDDAGLAARRAARNRGEAAVDRIHILALRVEFQPDAIETTSGDGRFLREADPTVLVDPPPHTRAYFEDHLEALSRYYRRVSRGQAELTFEVFPREEAAAYVLNDSMSVYGTIAGDDTAVNAGLARLARDALLAADADPAIDFSRFQSVLIFHAGVGADFSVTPGFDPTPLDLPSAFLGFRDLFDGLAGGNPQWFGIPVDEGATLITEVLILPETESRDGREIGLNGILAHQFGHQLGLPSLFDVDEGRPGVGQFALMDVGFGNQEGLVPPEPCAWSKVFLGWETPVPVVAGTALPVFTSGSADPRRIYRIAISATEYFLIENRTTDYGGDGLNSTVSDRGVLLEVDDYDSGLPGPGMLIWHIDERIIKATLSENRVNADRERRGVDLEEADGSEDIGQSFEGALPGFSLPVNGIPQDAFYQGNNDAFTPTTVPSSVSNDRAVTGIAVTGISAIDTVMTFDLTTGLQMPGFPAFAGELSTVPPAVGDLDGDGTLEIVALDAAGRVLAWNGEDGSPYLGTVPAPRLLLNGETIQVPVPLVAEGVEFREEIIDLLLADLNGDGRVEVLGAGDFFTLYFWANIDRDGDGRLDLLRRFPLIDMISAGPVGIRLADGTRRFIIGGPRGLIASFTDDRLLDTFSSWDRGWSPALPAMAERRRGTGLSSSPRTAG